MAVLGNKSKANLVGVHPDLVKVIEESIKDTPVDFTVFSGVRTDQEQKHLYSLGRTVVNPDGKTAKKPMGNVVTKADGVKNKSNHQKKADGFCHAVDLYPYYNGKIQFNDIDSLIKISIHIKAVAKCLGVKISYGGDWTYEKQGIVDYPHFQLA